MELEAIRCVRDWLDHGVNAADGTLASVAAILPAIPRDPGDPEPLTPPIADATRDPWVAELHAPADLTEPVLAVFSTGLRTDGEVRTGSHRTGTIEIVIVWLTKDSQSANVLRDGYYVRRAVMKSLRYLNDNANDAARTRNSVVLWSCESMDAATGIIQKFGDAIASGAVKVTYTIRDKAA